MPTKFAFEVPLNHLKDFADLQDYGFFLSMQMEDKRIQEQFAICKRKWMITILDNSFNELQVATKPETMANLYWLYSPTYVVSPDDDKWTGEQVWEAWSTLRDYVPTERIMVIYKSGQEYRYLKGTMSLTACSYAQRDTLPKEYMDKTDHFLGILNPNEIRVHKPKTCDTGMPIKIALEGKTLDQWIKEGCPHIYTQMDYFEERMTAEQVHLARTNIYALKEVCRW